MGGKVVLSLPRKIHYSGWKFWVTVGFLSQSRALRPFRSPHVYDGEWDGARRAVPLRCYAVRRVTLRHAEPQRSTRLGDSSTTIFFDKGARPNKSTATGPKTPTCLEPSVFLLPRSPISFALRFTRLIGNYYLSGHLSSLISVNSPFQ